MVIVVRASTSETSENTTGERSGVFGLDGRKRVEEADDDEKHLVKDENGVSDGRDGGVLG